MYRLFLAMTLPVLTLGATARDEVSLSPKTVLKGKWAGEGKVEKGKWEGQTMAWRLEFGKGDLSEVSGHIISSVKEVKARVHPTKPFKMTVNYEMEGAGVYAINLEARLDPTCTKLSGTFTNVMGNGTFELIKQGTTPDTTLAGNWTGKLTAGKGRWLRRGESATFTIACPKKGSWDGVTGELEGMEVQEVVPSIWDAESRGAILFLRFRQEGKDKDLWLQVSGSFSEDGKSFEGSYESSALGSGEVRLER
ncbi:MAG: hypothetical protein RL885_09275 [Planctomycetota bacterium]